MNDTDQHYNSDNLPPVDVEVTKWHGDQYPPTSATDTTSNRTRDEIKDGGSIGNGSSDYKDGQNNSICTISSALKDKFPHLKFKCDICGKTFSNSWNLHRHLKIHIGQIFYTYHYKPIVDQNHPSTSATDTTSNRIRDEIKDEVSIRKESSECKDGQSDSISTISSVLEDNFPHLKFRCEICGKTFSNNCNLNRHLKIHIGQIFYTYQFILSPKRFEMNDAHQHWNSDNLPPVDIESTKYHGGQNSPTSATDTTSNPIRDEIKDGGSIRNESSDCKDGQNNSICTISSVLNDNFPHLNIRCEICDKTFSNDWNLHRHLKIHIGQIFYTYHYILSPKRFEMNDAHIGTRITCLQ